jgi:hypothetical protein
LFWFILTPLVIVFGSLIIWPFESIGGKVNRRIEHLLKGRPKIFKAYDYVGVFVVLGWLIGMVYVLDKFM